MLDLDPIKARLKAATPGRWCYMNNYGEPPAGGWNVYGPDVEVVAQHATRDDATLIANAPADLAALVAEVERLRAELRIEKAQRLTDAHMFSRQIQEANAQHAWILDAVRCHRREAQAVNILNEPALADARLWAEVLE